jgi:hypothetical protein
MPPTPTSESIPEEIEDKKSRARRGPATVCPSLPAPARNRGGSAIATPRLQVACPLGEPEPSRRESSCQCVNDAPDQPTTKAGALDAC